MIGTLLGGLKAVREVKAQKRSLDKELQEELNRRNRRTGEDSTRRADARQMLTELDRRLREHTMNTEGRRALTGNGSEATVAAEKRRATDTIAQAVSAIAADGEKRRETADEEYARRRREIEARRRELLGLEAREAVKAGGLL